MQVSPGRRYQRGELFLGNAPVISGQRECVPRKESERTDKALSETSASRPARKRKCPGASCVNSLGTQHFSLRVDGKIQDKHSARTRHPEFERARVLRFPLGDEKRTGTIRCR